MTLDELNMFLRNIPIAPLLLTLAGLLPFFGTLTGLWIWRDETGLLLTAALWMLVYAAMILSFLGGVRWGAELLVQAKPRWAMLSLSVLGALAGWGLVMAAFSPVIRPWMFMAMAGLHVFYYVSDQMTRDLPDWYRRLRIWPTLGAVTCLLGAAVLLSRI